MKAQETNFLRFLNKADQLQIPIYQRTYSWTQEECSQLWKDIVRSSLEDSEGHFIGSIVYIDTGVYQVAASNATEVIDGQQRLTTVSLLLLALARAQEQEGSTGTARKILRDYLLQEDEESEGSEARYKLLLTKGDREVFMGLIDNREVDVSEAPRLLEAFSLFEDQLRRTPLPLEAVMSGIGKLLIVDIALERERDNPQLIFESLNSTGLDLSQADLVRNYVLMGLPHKEQVEIYTHSWYPLEQSFPSDQPNLFDRFMRDYLTMKTGQIPRIDRVYETFKVLAQNNELSNAEDVADLFRHSKNWVRLAFGRAEDSALAQALEDLNQLKVDVAYPFLLEVLDDRDEGIISDTDVIEVVRLVESYVFRRAIVGIPTNALNTVFAALAREVDKTDYIQSLRAVLLLKESYSRMPSDEEFRNAFVIKNVYQFRSRNFLLRKLENFGRKEPVDVDSYTIEHIMPQNKELSPEWQDDLGADWREVDDRGADWREVQERWLHTIGNLTLTGYNSELSDHPFATKLSVEGGFRDSPLRLNQYLAKLETWNETEIQHRAQMLADLALEIWPLPSVAEETLEKYREARKRIAAAVYTLDDHPALTGHIQNLFDEFRKRVLNLDDGVSEEVRKQYIAYKVGSNFVEAVPLSEELKLYLDARPAELNDPKGLTRDVTAVGHWGTGNVEVRLSGMDAIDDVMDLVRQSFELQGEDQEEEPEWSEIGVERVVEQASDPELQKGMLRVVESAVRCDLYPRPRKRGLMFAPQAKRSKALFTLWLRGDDQVDFWSSAEAFQTFYGIDPSEVERLLGPPGTSSLQVEEVSALADRLEELMAHAEVSEATRFSRAPKGGLYGEFWPSVMRKLHDVAPGWLSDTKGTPRWHRLVLPAKRTGAWYALQFTQDKHLRVTLFLKPRAWKQGGAESLASLKAKMPEVEERFGGPIVWDEAEGRDRIHIAAIREGDADVERRDQWPEYQAWLVETAVKFRQALQGEIDNL